MKLKLVKTAVIVFCFAIGLGAAARASGVSIGYFDTIMNDPAIEAGQTYYLRHNLMFEKSTWEATNYWRGTLLPINTKVTVTAIDYHTVSFKWDGGKLMVVNSEHTMRRMETIAKHLLSPNPVPIEKFGEHMAQRIASGTLTKGMTREQVIMTRGWPPGHKTPDITSDNGRWMYWSSRFGYVTLVITDGLLKEGRSVKD